MELCYNEDIMGPHTQKKKSGFSLYHGKKKKSKELGAAKWICYIEGFVISKLVITRFHWILYLILTQIRVYWFCNVAVFKIIIHSLW